MHTISKIEHMYSTINLFDSAFAFEYDITWPDPSVANVLGYPTYISLEVAPDHIESVVTVEIAVDEKISVPDNLKLFYKAKFYAPSKKIVLSDTNGGLEGWESYNVKNRVFNIKIYMAENIENRTKVYLELTSTK